MNIYKEIADCFSLFQDRKFNEAIISVDALLERPATNKTDYDILKLLNNYLIACVETRQYQRGIDKFIGIADIAGLNPHIFHNAACLYVLTGQADQALTQLKLAKKFGGRTLINVFKGDPDLKPLFGTTEYKKITEEPISNHSCKYYQIPLNGLLDEQFNHLSKSEKISMFFLAKVPFTDPLKTTLKQGLEIWKKESGWNPMDELKKRDTLHWYDATRVCSDWIEIHLVEVDYPRKLMNDAVTWIEKTGIELVHSFFSKRTRYEASWGNIELEVVDPDPGIEVADEEELMRRGFSTNEDDWPTSEYPGERYYIGHHNGSCAGELRTMTRRNDLVICYGEVSAKHLEQNDRSIAIYEYLQRRLGLFFNTPLPFVLNARGDHQIDRIEKNGRTGYSFELINDDLLTQYYNRYVFRLKEAELFEVIKSAIVTFDLANTVFWKRDSFTRFQIWEK